MKIAILTFHKAYNYGAVLQCIALEYVMNSIDGLDAEVLDYQCRQIADGYRPWHLYNKDMKNVLVMLYMFVPRSIRIHKFKKFVKKYMKVSNLSYDKKTIAQTSDMYDCFITGSDQVWSPVCTGDDSTYFLDFVSEKEKKAAYAASFGFHELPDGYQKKYQVLLKNYGHMSIREVENLAILKQLDIVNGEVHIDPVFLPEKKFWISMMKKPNKKNYLLIYLLKPSPEMIEYGKRLAKKRGCCAILLAPDYIHADNIKTIHTAGPDEFLGWVYHAEFVLTNSFHGLSFCIIFRKQFRVGILDDFHGTNTRLYNLLKIFHMENCIFSKESKIEEIEKIDFKNVDTIISGEREKSLLYLKSLCVKHANEKKDFSDIRDCFLDNGNTEKCSGCGACYSVCPAQAILMKTDEMGFFYPEISKEKCIKCGLCQKVCKTKRTYKYTVEQRFFGVKLVNEKERARSRSGGLFYALSSEILSKGGSVYGAGYDGEFLVEHKRVITRKECKKLQGVKYVQSPSWKIYQYVAKDLEHGMKVLFSGTPCQVNGLIGFLEQRKINMDLLFTCDNVCHGVPSPLIWKEYLEYLKKKRGKKIKKVDFRNKEFGWNSHVESIWYEDGSVDHNDYFARLFWKNLMLRPSCYLCPYASLHRVSDITMGDFWGIDKTDSEFADTKGVSLCIVNSQKGLELLESVKDAVTVREYRSDECMQPNLQCATEKPEEYECFWRRYQKHGIKYIISKYASVHMGERIYTHVRKNKKR